MIGSPRERAISFLDRVSNPEAAAQGWGLVYVGDMIAKLTEEIRAIDELRSRRDTPGTGWVPLQDRRS